MPISENSFITKLNLSPAKNAALLFFFRPCDQLRFPVDPESVHVFDRNDAVVHPALRSRLKLPRRYWRINLTDEFNALLKTLEKGVLPSPRTPKDNLRILSNEIQPLMVDITRRVHHTHPNYDLENLFAEVFKNVPGVVNVHWQGGAGDQGADIIVTFESGLPIPGLESQAVLVVQVKSYEGEHWDIGAVDDLSRAFDHYPDASMGLIISTADSASAILESALDELREKKGKPVTILIGPDVAAFLLRYGTKLLA
ncbi:MAG: restriction endonuclease [Desulfobacca sp.]|nr:restriction endonuclease [Desulfobacca sp.]